MWPEMHITQSHHTMENIRTIAAKYLTRVIEAWEQFSQPVEMEIPGRARKDRPRLPIVKVSIIFFLL